MSVVGFLDARSADVITERLRGFRQGLKETGYVEGENVAIVYRFAENQTDRLPEPGGRSGSPPSYSDRDGR
jgi:putative ABC transport system substrate-binding protein